jgi:hypothetical protein
MAEIWFYAEGELKQDGELDERPFEDCVALLELSADRYLGQDPTQAPEAQAKVTAGDSYLVVAVGDEEASAIGWRPGYYPSPLPPKEGLERLGIDPSEAVGA